MKRNSIPAVAYLRVSGKGQAGADKDGFPRQRDAIAKFAHRNNYEIVSEFKDEGVSGTRELDYRPGLTALIDRIASNGVRVVIIERADRLARDLMIGEIILDKLKKHDAIVLTTDGQNLTAGGEEFPTQTLIRQVLGAVAQFEKTVLVAKLRGARQRKRARGERVEGRKPFGELPGEAPILERMRELRKKLRGGEQLSLQAIADRLNDEGLPTRSGTPWVKNTVARILAREKRGTAQRANAKPRP